MTQFQLKTSAILLDWNFTILSVLYFLVQRLTKLVEPSLSHNKVVDVIF